MERKFKVGNVIRVADKDDMAYSHDNFYEVVSVEGGNYNLRSLKRNVIYDEEALSGWFEYSKRQSDIKIAIIANECRNYNEYIDACYRLVTRQEMIISGRKEI